MTICATKDFGQFELVVFLPSHWIGCQGVRHHHQSRWQQLELITFARIVQYKLFWADYWSHSVALLGGGCQLCKAEICHILQKVIFCHQQNNFGDTDDGAGDFFPSSVFGCILYIFVEMSLCLLFCFHVLQDPDACSVGGKTSGYRLMVWHTVAQCGTGDSARQTTPAPRPLLRLATHTPLDCSSTERALTLVELYSSRPASDYSFWPCNSPVLTRPPNSTCGLVSVRRRVTGSAVPRCSIDPPDVCALSAHYLSHR